MSADRFTIQDCSPRFGEFDLGGVLYHANYFHLYEEAREKFLASGPVSYSALVGQDCHLAVTESEQKFLKPIRYGFKFDIELTVAELKRASFNFHYSFKAEGIEIHRGRTRMVFIKNESAGFSVSSLPAELKSYLQRYVNQ